MSKGKIFFIIGAPASGKSTLCQLMGRKLSKAVHIPVDDIREMVISGLISPNPNWNDGLQMQVTLARSTALNMASLYSEQGFSVFIDDFYDPLKLREYQNTENRFESDVYKVILYPNKIIAKQRNVKRSGGDPIIDEGIDIVYDLLSERMKELESGGWYFLDNSKISVEQTAKILLNLD